MSSNKNYDQGYFAALAKFQVKEAGMFDAFTRQMGAHAGNIGMLGKGLKGFAMGGTPETMMQGRNMMGMAGKRLMAPAALLGGGYMAGKMMNQGNNGNGQY